MRSSVAGTAAGLESLCVSLPSSFSLRRDLFQGAGQQCTYSSFKKLIIMCHDLAILVLYGTATEQSRHRCSTMLVVSWLGAYFSSIPLKPSR